MAEIGRSGASSRKGRKKTAPASPSGPGSRPDRFAFIMDATTGEIIEIEGIDATGMRRELSTDEKAKLGGDNGRVRLEDLLEEAFEAGIACVLGGKGEPDEPAEAKEDADLRRILLRPLIDESPAARLMRRDVLDRAIIETLIHNGISSRSGSLPEHLPKEPDTDHAAPEAN